MKKQSRGGFTFSVTKEQVELHKKRSLEEIFTWLEETNAFLKAVQTDKEKQLMEKLRKGEI